MVFGAQEHGPHALVLGVPPEHGGPPRFVAAVRGQHLHVQLPEHAVQACGDHSSYVIVVIVKKRARGGL